MSGTRCKQEPTQTLQLRMGHDRRHEHAAVALASVFLKHKHIDEIGESGAIRDHSRIRNLVLAEEQPKVQRVIERLADDLDGNATCPSGLVCKEPMDDVDILRFNGRGDVR